MRKSSKTQPSSTGVVSRQLSDLSMLIPEVVARRTLRVAKLGPWSPRGRSEMNRMVSEKAIASTQSGFAMWMELLSVAQKSWMTALSGSWFPGSRMSLSVAQSPMSIGSDVLAKGLEPLRRKTSSNAKRLRRGG